MRMHAMKKRAAKVNAVKVPLFFLWRIADVMVNAVAAKTRITNTTLNACSMFCCCSTYADDDKPIGLKPIQIPKLAPARIAAMMILKNRIK